MGHGHSLRRDPHGPDVHTRRAEGIRRSRGRLPSSFNQLRLTTRPRHLAPPFSRRRKRTEDACFLDIRARNAPCPAGIGVACRGDAGATDPRWSAACERRWHSGRRDDWGDDRAGAPPCLPASTLLNGSVSAARRAALKRYPGSYVRVAHHARASDPGYALLRQTCGLSMARKMIFLRIHPIGVTCSACEPARSGSTVSVAAGAISTTLDSESGVRM